MKNIGKLDRTGFLAILFGVIVTLSTAVCSNNISPVPTPQPTFKAARIPTATAIPTSTPLATPIKEQNQILYGGGMVTHALSFHLKERTYGVVITDFTDTRDKFVVLKAPEMSMPLYLGTFSYNQALGNIYNLSDPTAEVRLETEYRHSCMTYGKCIWYEIQVEEGGFFLPRNLGRREELLK